MQNFIPVHLEDGNAEVAARIVRAVSEKFDCTIEIDFNNGKRRLTFVGDKGLVPHIVEEVRDFFR